MIASHTIVYLGSRALAAATNVLLLAVLTRLASAETYGSYLLVASWAFILCGFGCQWSKFAFFALFQDDSANTQIATVIRVTVAALSTIVLLCAGAVMVGLVEASTAAAIAALAVGMTFFETAVEISRTRLDAVAVAAAVLSRAVLSLGLGIGTLLLSRSATHLAAGIALANVLAIWLPAWRLRRLAMKPGSMAVFWQFFIYGWPLILSFGITALGQNVDRVILASNIGTGPLGGYGAISDFLKQGFFVFGEAISLPLISLAKRDVRAGNLEAARATLEDAFRALAAVASFGSAMMLIFEARIIGLVLGPGFRSEALELAPYLIVANVFLIFRAFYFGQIIYFVGSSRLDLIASVVLFAAAGGMSYVLVPYWGATGAAVSLAAGQALACAVFIIGANGSSRMPLPFRDMLGISVIAGMCLVPAMTLRKSLSTEPVLQDLVSFAVFSIGFAVAVLRFNIIRLGDKVRNWRERVS